MSVVVIAEIVPAAGRSEEVLAVVDRIIPLVHTEPGCERYALQVAEDGRLVMIESWADAQALRAHGGGEHFSALSAGLDGLLAEPLGVRTFAPHPAGDAVKGTVAGS